MKGLNEGISIRQRRITGLFSIILLLALPSYALAHSVSGLLIYSEYQPVDGELLGGNTEFSVAQSEPTSGDDDFSDFEEEYGSENRPTAGETYDPFIGYNRAMFKFNDWMFDHVLFPMIKGYNFVLPQKVRVSFAKFFHNLTFPLRFVNNLLQLKIKGAVVETGRFVVNTTLGIAGLFDPADHYFGWLPRNEDFGQTLAFWGVGPGPPFVIPLLGTSNLRDAIGILPTYAVHPVYYIADYPVYLGEQGLEYFNFASLHFEEYQSIKRDAFDPYTFLRDAYRQNREKQIRE